MRSLPRVMTSKLHLFIKRKKKSEGEEYLLCGVLVCDFFSTMIYYCNGTPLIMWALCCAVVYELFSLWGLCIVVPLCTYRCGGILSQDKNMNNE